MNLEQALQVLGQALDLANSEGVFKTTRDSSIVNAAFETLKSSLEPKEEKMVSEAPTEKKTK